MIFFLFGSPVLFDEEMVNFFHFAFAHPSIGMLLLPPLSLCATPCFSFPFSLSRIFLCVWVAFLTMLFFSSIFFSTKRVYLSLQVPIYKCSSVYVRCIWRVQRHILSFFISMSSLSPSLLFVHGTLE